MVIDQLHSTWNIQPNLVAGDEFTGYESVYSELDAFDKAQYDADPQGTIEIAFTGLKPGEKLHEELLVGGDVTGTVHRKIMRAEEHYPPWADLSSALNTLEAACGTFDDGAIKTFIEGLVKGADLETQLEVLTPMSSKVVDIKRPD